MFFSTTTSPASCEYRQAGIISRPATTMGMKPRPAPAPPPARATATAPTPMSRRMIAMTNQTMMFPFSGFLRVDSLPSKLDIA